MEATLNDRLRRLCRWHPQIARGGMSWAQLRNLARRIGDVRNVEVAVHVRPWPWPGTARWVGDVLVITIDGRRSPFDRLYALAHEVGHLALGHCYLQDREVWYHQDGDSADLVEHEADAFAAFATRTPGLPAEWYIGEQMHLL